MHSNCRRLARGVVGAALCAQLALSLAAASVEDPPAAGMSGTDLPMLAADTPWADVPEQCKSFEIVGMTTSPGGNELPNKCAPFDGTLNNPYAIRCVDADPSFKTKYAGDDYCILPPPDELGVQVHVGPPMKVEYRNWRLKAL